MASILNYDVINQGIYDVLAKMKVDNPAPDFLQRAAFPTSRASNDPWIAWQENSVDADDPGAAMRGGDPVQADASASFTEDMVMADYFAKEYILSPRLAENRVPGETLTLKLTPDARIMRVMSEKIQTWRKGVILAREAKAAAVLRTNTFASNQGETFSFPENGEGNAHLSLDGANLFTKPYETMMAACTAVVGAAGHPVASVVFNPTDWAKLVESTAFQKLCDNRRFRVGEVDAGLTDSSLATQVGTMAVPGSVGNLRVYVYAGQDKDRNYFVPQGSAILLPSGGVGFRGDCAVYVSDGQEVSVPIGQEFRQTFFARKRGDLSNTVLQLQAAPVFVPEKVGSWGVITGIPAA